MRKTLAVDVKDAHGNTPALTHRLQKKWRDRVGSGDLNKGYNLLGQREAFLLKEKNVSWVLWVFL